MIIPNWMEKIKMFQTTNQKGIEWDLTSRNGDDKLIFEVHVMFEINTN